MTDFRQLVTSRPGVDADEPAPIGCGVKGCGEVNYDDRRPYLCRNHGLAIAQRFQAALRAVAEEAAGEQVRQRRAARATARRGGFEEAPACVYYARIGDIIKIGFTRHLWARMRALRVSHLDLLAVEPGGREVERARHLEFRAERAHARMENFHPSERLLGHIAALGGRDTVPTWARIADPQEVRVRVTS